MKAALSILCIVTQLHGMESKSQNFTSSISMHQYVKNIDCLCKTLNATEALTMDAQYASDILQLIRAHKINKKDMQGKLPIDYATDAMKQKLRRTVAVLQAAKLKQDIEDQYPKLAQLAQVNTFDGVKQLHQDIDESKLKEWQGTVDFLNRFV